MVSSAIAIIWVVSHKTEQVPPIFFRPEEDSPISHVRVKAASEKALATVDATLDLPLNQEK